MRKISYESRIFADRRDSAVSRHGNAWHVQKLVRRRRAARSHYRSDQFIAGRRIELYSRRLDFYSASPSAFFLLRRSALCDVIESRGRMYAFQGAISPALGLQDSWAFCPSSRGLSALSTGTEWLSCRSIRIYFPPRRPSAPAADAGHRCYGRPQNENNPVQSCLRIDLYPSPPNLHPY